MAVPCLASTCDLQALLDRPDVAAIELSGVFRGHFEVGHDVALTGLVGQPPPFLVAPDAWLGGAALLARDADLSVGGVGFVGALVVLGGTVDLDVVRFDTSLRCLSVRDADATVARTAFHTCGEGAVDLVGGALLLTDSTFTQGFLPAVHAVGARSVVLDRVVATTQLAGEPPDGSPDPVLWFEDVDALAASRTWVCDNAGVGLWVTGGCADGCAVDHAVLSRNIGDAGGGVVWDAPSGHLERTTFVDNVADEGGAVVVVRSGALALSSSIVVDALATDDSFEVRSGSLTLTDSTVFSSRPGLPLLQEDGNEARRVAFVADPLVPDLCGPGAVPDPRAPENASVARWPEPEGRGALSTDCGPWCEDADADGSPAMWDCDEANPRRGDDRPEVWLDGVDQDCDGTDACLADRDGDGVAGTEIPVGPDCGLIPEVPDCDDADPDRVPGGTEVPGDDVDGDCDGIERCFPDADGDGAPGAEAVDAPGTCEDPGWSPTAGGDCDDDDPAVQACPSPSPEDPRGCETAPAGGALPLAAALLRRRTRRAVTSSSPRPRRAQ